MRLAQGFEALEKAWAIGEYSILSCIIVHLEKKSMQWYGESLTRRTECA